MALSADELKDICGVPPPETKDFYFQHTMIRVKDIRKSLHFYTQILGMRLLHKCDFHDLKFTLYFLAFADGSLPSGATTPTIETTFQHKAVLELTHNWGTESDEKIAYHNGNKDPKGFGHVAIHVPDLEAACQRFEQLGVPFTKKPNDGTLKGFAFIRDPDDYWVEIVNAKSTCCGIGQ